MNLGLYGLVNVVVLLNSRKSLVYFVLSSARNAAVTVVGIWNDGPGFVGTTNSSSQRRRKVDGGAVRTM